jgi:hypothetical protein
MYAQYGFLYYILTRPKLTVYKYVSICREEYRKEFQGNLYRMFPNQTVLDDSEFDQGGANCHTIFLAFKYIVRPFDFGG